MGETYYDRLGVSSTASTDEIEAAYREKLKDTHPDVSDEEGAQVETRRLIEAKETLTDEEERNRYDRLGHDRYVAIENATPGDGGSAGGGSTAASRTTDTGAAWSGATGGGTSGRSTETGQSDWGSRNRDGSTTGRGNRTGGAHATGAGATADGGAAASASWYDGTGSTGDGRNQRGRSSGGGSPGETAGGGDDPWHAWNTNATYSVRRGSDGFASWGLTSDGPQLLLVATLFVYPVLLFGALYPRFPLFLRAIIGVCILLTIAYMQSQPGVGIIVFGVWSLLLPIVIFASGFGLVTLSSFLALIAVMLPFGLSVLTMIALRSVNI